MTTMGENAIQKRAVVPLWTRHPCKQTQCCEHDGIFKGTRKLRLSSRRPILRENWRQISNSFLPVQHSKNRSRKSFEDRAMSPGHRLPHSFRLCLEAQVESVSASLSSTIATCIWVAVALLREILGENFQRCVYIRSRRQ